VTEINTAEQKKQPPSFGGIQPNNNNKPTKQQRTNKMIINELTFLINTYNSEPLILKFETLRSLLLFLEKNIDNIESFQEINIKTIS
jgi:hypothetical protein